MSDLKFFCDSCVGQTHTGGRPGLGEPYWWCWAEEMRDVLALMICQSHATRSLWLSSHCVHTSTDWWSCMVLCVAIPGPQLPFALLLQLLSNGAWSEVRQLKELLLLRKNMKHRQTYPLKQQQKKKQTNKKKPHIVYNVTRMTSQSPVNTVWCISFIAISVYISAVACRSLLSSAVWGGSISTAEGSLSHSLKAVSLPWVRALIQMQTHNNYMTLL